VSANFWTGALESWARSTSATICESGVVAHAQHAHQECACGVQSAPSTGHPSALATGDHSRQHALVHVARTCNVTQGNAQCGPRDLLKTWLSSTVAHVQGRDTRGMGAVHCPKSTSPVPLRKVQCACFSLDQHGQGASRAGSPEGTLPSVPAPWIQGSTRSTSPYCSSPGVEYLLALFTLPSAQRQGQGPTQSPVKPLATKVHKKKGCMNQQGSMQRAQLICSLEGQERRGGVQRDGRARGNGD